MAEEIQPGSPQHEQIRAEYGAALASGDQAKIEAAGKKYEAFGNKPAAGQDGGVSAGPAPTQDEQDASYEAQALAQCDAALKEEWGAEYESRMEAIVGVVDELFPTPEAALMAGRLEQALIASGADLAEINRLLWRIAQRGK